MVIVMNSFPARHGMEIEDPPCRGADARCICLVAQSSYVNVLGELEEELPAQRQIGGYFEPLPHDVNHTCFGTSLENHATQELQESEAFNILLGFATTITARSRLVCLTATLHGIPYFPVDSWHVTYPLSPATDIQAFLSTEGTGGERKKKKKMRFFFSLHLFLSSPSSVGRAPPHSRDQEKALRCRWEGCE
ncbi:hypothetical protein TNCV_4819021 [Trichonephila clavipes]|nr:hypothetical protein TNCV_4819021 [Trichonephila clavipes]